MSSIDDQLQQALAERDALLELKREKEAREQAEAKASLARTRSAEKASELAAAKAELARLKSMKSGGGGGYSQAKSPVQEELEAAMAERDALLELKREKQAREQAEAKASLARTRSAEKSAELAAAKAELARLRAMQRR